MSVRNQNTGNGNNAKPGNNNQQTAMGAAFSEAGYTPVPETTRPVQPSPAAAPTSNNTTSYSKSVQSPMSNDTLFTRDIGRRAVGETTHALAEALRKRLTGNISQQAKDLYQIQVMDNSNGNHFSSILICKAVMTTQGPIVSAYAMLVEASNQKLPSRPVQIQGTSYPVPTVAGDAIDEVLREKTIAFLKTIYSADARVILAGAQVLYTETVKADDEATIGNLIWLATEATSNGLASEGVVEEQPIDVKALTQGASTVAGIDWAPAPLHDVVGMPVRSDWSITTRSVSEQGQNNWSPNASTSKDLVRVDGYVDIDYSVPQQAQQQIYGGQALQPLTQRYIPRLVLTRVDSLVPVETPELQLLALATVPLLGVANSWMQSFKPTWQSSGKKGDINLRDITAIGFEVNLTGADKPGRLPAASQSDMGKFYQMLALAISKDLLISMDIEEAGDLTWLQRDFYLAALNDPEAIRSVLAAANRLTDGRFGQMWDGSQPIAIDEGNRVPLGYWQSASGMRDIRDLDYTAMLNIVGEKDMQVLHDWSETFYNQQIPQEIRLEKRHRIQSELLSGYTLKGYARRIVRNQKFLATLAQALHAAGLLLSSQDTLVDLTGQTIRGNYNTNGYTLDMGSANIGLYSSGATGYGNYRGIGAAPMSRFGR